MTDLTIDLMDLCKFYSRAVERLESENKELGIEVHALWEKQNQLEAENAALKARVQELETPDLYFIHCPSMQRMQGLRKKPQD